MRIRPTVLALLGSLVILTGCTAEPPAEVTVTSPVPRPTTAPTAVAATPTESATTPAVATPPAIPVPTPPAEMARDDEIGAIAAAEYFMTDLYVYTVNSQDTVPWRAMSTEECTFCSSIADRVDTMRAGGETARVSPISAEGATYELVEPGLYRVAFAFTTGLDEFFAADGSTSDHFAPTTARAGFHVRRSGQVWLVDGGTAIEDGTDIE